MDEPTFEEFINKKIEEEPHLAEQNRALLDMYEKDLIKVVYDSSIRDFNIQASVAGKQWYYTSLAGAFVPAEA
tara:strand:+ start:15018 stop:15236 length:219 start_codon:yes stop_codon:yes gene_type:complete